MAIKITAQNIETFKQQAFESYLDELAIHCNENYPYLQRTLGKEKLKNSLENAVIKAKQSGLTQRGPVRFYIDMMIVFGSEFETDPQYPWIKETLTKNSALPQLEKTFILYQQVDDYLNAIKGDQDQCLKKVASKLQTLTLDNMDVHRENYIQHVHTLLYKIYPEKYQKTKQDDITLLIRHATTKAQLDYKLTKANHAAVIVLLAFLLGHEFDQDIFYQWINKEKLEHYITDHDLFINKVVTRAKIWLAGAIKANWDNEPI